MIEIPTHELREAMEEWIVFRLKDNLELPVVEGVDLNIAEHNFLKR